MKHLVCAIFWLILLPIRLAVSILWTLVWPVVLLIGLITLSYRWSCMDRPFNWFAKDDAQFIGNFYWKFLICNKWDKWS